MSTVVSDDYFQTLPGRRFLKKLTDFYKEGPMGPSEIICPFCKNTGRHLCPDVSEPVEIDCSHKQCPVMLQKEIDRLNSVLTPHENWVVKSLEGLEARIRTQDRELLAYRIDNKKMAEALAGRGGEGVGFDQVDDLARVKFLEEELDKYKFALNRFKNHVGWARTQNTMQAAMNCIDTATTVVADILNGKTPVPENRDDLKV